MVQGPAARPLESNLPHSVKRLNTHTASSRRQGCQIIQTNVICNPSNSFTPARVLQVMSVGLVKLVVAPHRSSEENTPAVLKPC